ncbi:MAG TPA: hypothetical protein VLE99_02955 [Candidatus Saccharimonadales bacterium]|nr:hypothetical protein [Candidatus Saccharimonadales bacterium]
MDLLRQPGAMAGWPGPEASGLIQPATTSWDGYGSALAWGARPTHNTASNDAGAETEQAGLAATNSSPAAPATEAAPPASPATEALQTKADRHYFPFHPRWKRIGAVVVGLAIMTGIALAKPVPDTDGPPKAPPVATAPGRTPGTGSSAAGSTIRRGPHGPTPQPAINPEALRIDPNEGWNTVMARAGIEPQLWDAVLREDTPDLLAHWAYRDKALGAAGIGLLLGNRRLPRSVVQRLVTTAQTLEQ